MSKVGIVLISHSKQIVDGLYELIRQVEKEVVIACAGGTEDGRIGTSLEKIKRAIQEANSEAGVLMFYDLGSAKMNGELVVEFSDVSDVYLVDAPLIEGSYIAAVEAGLGKQAVAIKEEIESYYSS
ncbi:dihydroxyacetone kinase phosphoryl donor subunit DhaM [Bacillus sp. FJAT-52991]|uniref:phosphoenolpyruvate--glycerone phosphotransferase n=1 Tax=Bacillus kandeliae TaxID=3129297 RepID=A0ABZ2N9S3_9BACI